MGIAFLGHMIVHTALLYFLVPKWGLSEEDLGEDLHADVSYKEVNEQNACSWFSANMVHCLRSKYIYCHDTPCMYAKIGREHLLQINEELGCFYSSLPMEREVFDVGKLMTEVMTSCSSLFRDKVSGGDSPGGARSQGGSPSGAGPRVSSPSSSQPSGKDVGQLETVSEDVD